ncbi:placenta-expressed transcript 1 protein [Cricetulus griseus]|nr:placenta-expressed transcript 1 protein [Cricetulus griseus]XP_027267922.1 placenta-expressed transcript 1 protein [Cricetulus griseus]EGW03826.1 Placenta-expressed transcript 1 protein [Cricetulus griseus]ERE76157.1 placenta-expressed transcript 1 protein [Cricetulus griseus]
MAVLRSLLPQLGLFLCLALCFSPALSASYNDPCMVFDTISTSDNLGVSITVAGSSGENITYTVLVHVNSSVSAVILKAVNQNKPVGSWVGATQECNDSSVLYRVTPSDSSGFQATWIVPNSEDMTKVNLHVFLATGNGTAAMTSVNLGEQKTPVTVNPTPEISETNQTTAMTTDRTTAKSLAVNALGSPLAGAFHILLVFLISKLLF